eukprot:TRINITY_DN6724_c1_g1_i1.p1 TRINITY_DN6724_c1_g1~~TRINITY_DN6724_c1_g1_i1.p1  ORF type:complete len:228 (-),score=47.15 TRINITY_DN6724_c1_g1_i1:68-751(-)
MKIIGITGGISSGKSTVVSFFKEVSRIPIIDSDIIARDVVKPNTTAYKKIVQHFGRDYVLNDGSLDRSKLAKRVFSDHEARKFVNKITHFPIAFSIFLFLLKYFLRGEKVVILDVPLLYETGLNKICSKVIVVYVDEDKQIERLMKRDNITKEDAIEKISSQVPLSKKKSRATLVIDNNGTLSLSRNQVNSIFQNELQPILRSSRLPLVLGISCCLTLFSYLAWKCS